MLMTNIDRLPTVSAADALQALQEAGPEAIPSGLAALDDALRATGSKHAGGFERGKVTELWGPVGAGKTALLFVSRYSSG
jgi:RecA/RadA recombinase